MPTPRDAAPRKTARRAACYGVLLGAIGLMSGCEVDGWLGDPSVLGRWEHTPTSVPILERIDVIEANTGDFVDVTQVTPDDLVPEISEYVLGPGDFLRITIYGLFQADVPYVIESTVNENGIVDIPDVGRLRVAGRTAFEARRALAQLLMDEDRFNAQPIVDIQALSRQEASYSVFGAVQNPGRYSIPRPDHRLLEALTNAGGVSPVIREVFVIRQVPLSDAVAGRTPLPSGDDGSDIPRPEPIRRTPQEGRDGSGTQSILDLLDELSGEEKGGRDDSGSDDSGDPGAPAVMSMDPTLRRADRRAASPGVYGAQQGIPDGETPTINLDDDVAPPSMTDGPEAPIDLGEPAAEPIDQGEWRFINGRWVRVLPPDASDVEQLPDGDDPLDAEVTAEDLMTQRVIGIPTAPLLQGVSRYNIVIRPGDILHVPAPESGLVYAGGPGIARQGTYNLPQNGRLTIHRLIVTAGGLSAVSVPERVDLTRMVGDDRQATVRLNVRAIVEGTHPDVFLKPDDMVNFGTDFWSTPYAIIRNGFRMSYGFGFLLDRNFGNDVFGAPPRDNLQF